MKQAAFARRSAMKRAWRWQSLTNPTCEKLESQNWVYDVCSKENEAMADRSAAAKKASKTTKRRKAGKKAAKTRKLRSAGKKAAKTQKLSSAGKKAALTRKRRQAGRKAAATRRLKKEQSSSAPPTPQAEAPAVTNPENGDVHQ